MKTVTGFAPSDRYGYDFKKCTAAGGWAQIDTAQDASYFGQWCNPTTLEYFCYCEGDTTHRQADSAEEFAAFIRELAKWGQETGHGFAIDGMCRPEIIEQFERLGLSEFLH